ncbi:hypothetical protein Tco_1074238 [Tanacetum coccineum]
MYKLEILCCFTGGLKSKARIQVSGDQEILKGQDKVLSPLTTLTQQARKLHSLFKRTEDREENDVGKYE